MNQTKIDNAKRRNAGTASVEAASAAERMFNACKLAGIPCTYLEVRLLRDVFAVVGARIDGTPSN